MSNYELSNQIQVSFQTLHAWLRQQVSQNNFDSEVAWNETDPHFHLALTVWKIWISLLSAHDQSQKFLMFPLAGKTS